MKIAVVGAGAMGAIFGARFVQGGHDTVLVDVAAPLVERINADGVTIVRGDEETVTRVPATADPAAVGDRSTSSSSSSSATTPSPRPSSRGRSSGRRPSSRRSRTAGGTATSSRARYAAEQLVVGVTYNSGTVLDTGRVAHPGVGPTTIGSFADGANRRGRAARAGAVRRRPRGR